MAAGWSPSSGRGGAWAKDEPALAQADQAVNELRVSVLDTSSRGGRIDVPLYGSVSIETTVEVMRADVISRDIADVQVISPTRMLITGRGYGSTNIVLHGPDQQQRVLEVSVELDLKRLNRDIRRVDPLSDVQAHSVLGHLVLTGTASGAAQASRIVDLAKLFLPPTAAGGAAATVQNHMEVAGEQQVLLRCVVAEVSRAAARELGINGFLAGDHFRDAFVVNQIGGINPINIGAAGDALANDTIAFLTDQQGISIAPAATLSLGFPRIQLQAFIKTMAQNSLLKVLAEPNLVAISGETASFLAGGEFPIPVPQGNQTVTIEFREFGVRLNFTPVVRGQQRIRLRVAPEVSELDFTSAAQFQGFVIPGLTSRSTETTVELGNGETIAIAGLLSEQIRGLATRVPGIGDVPILGALFRSVEYRRSLTELVILVTPEIVAPLDVHQRVALPTDGENDPNDFDLYGLGLLDAPHAAETALPGRARTQTGSTQTGDSSSPARQAPGSSAGIPTYRDELSVHGPWGYAARR